VQTKSKNKERKEKEGVSGVAQVVESLTSKHKTLSSNPSTVKNKQKLVPKWIK
jgi:hypothetical protein